MREAKQKQMGRPRTFDEAGTLKVIMELFWANGFEGTSMADLVAATGLKKGSLYAAFGDKRAMYHKSLALYDEQQIDAAVRLLTGQGLPLERIARFLQTAIDPAIGRDRRGCFLCNASADQAAVDTETQTLVQRSMSRLERALQSALRDHATVRTGSETLQTVRRSSRHILATYLGLRAMARAGVKPNVLRDIKQSILDGIKDASFA